MSSTERKGPKNLKIPREKKSKHFVWTIFSLPRRLFLSFFRFLGCTSPDILSVQSFKFNNRNYFYVIHTNFRSPYSLRRSQLHLFLFGTSQFVQKKKNIIQNPFGWTSLIALVVEVFFVSRQY